MQLFESVRQFVRQHDLARTATRVVAALSGGSDSVALVHLLRELDASGDLRLVGAVHFNHQLRDTAERDEAFVSACVAALGVPLFTDRADVGARAVFNRQSIEGAARDARYDAFERARRHFDADLVALGHTRDDQAETFLLRLVRGAGPRGLAAMHPQHGAIIRPLLGCRRADLRAYLAARRIAFVNDETNSDVTIPRNRVRAELLPFLERFNPSIADVLADEADLARETWLWMEAAADELAARAVRARPSMNAGRPELVEGRPQEGGCELDVALLNQAPAALRRLVLWRAMNEMAAPRSVSFAHVEAALRLLTADQNPAADAPGLRVQRNGPVLVLTGRPPGAVGHGNAVNVGNPVNLFSYSLSIPGEVRLPEAGCVVSAEPGGAGSAAGGTGGTGGTGGDRQAATGKGQVALVRGDLCRNRVTVRNRRPGDRFQPVGLAGGKKLQDYFVDRKVARARRDLVPLIVDDQDRIVWVAGYGIDEAFRVTDASQGVLILKVRQV